MILKRFRSTYIEKESLCLVAMKRMKRNCMQCVLLQNIAHKPRSVDVVRRIHNTIFKTLTRRTTELNSGKPRYDSLFSLLLARSDSAETILKFDRNCFQ